MKFRPLAFDYYSEATHRLMEKETMKNKPTLWIVPYDDDDDALSDHGSENDEDMKQPIQASSPPKEEGTSQEEAPSPPWWQAFGDSSEEEGTQQPNQPPAPSASTASTRVPTCNPNSDHAKLRSSMRTPTPMLATTTAVVTDVSKNNKKIEEASKSTTNESNTGATTNESNTGEDKFPCRNHVIVTTSPPLQSSITCDLELHESNEQSNATNKEHSHKRDAINTDVMVPCISNSTQKVGGDEIVESTMEVDETETIEVSWSEATDISLTRPRPAKKDSPHHCLKRSMNVENPSRLLLLDQRPAKKVRRTEAIRHPKATRSVLLIDLSGISHQLLKLLSSIRRSKNQRRLSDEPCLHSFMISVNRLPNAPRLVGPCWIQNLLHSFQETACQSDKRLDSIKGLRMVNGHKADSSLTPASSWKGRFFGLNVGTRATRARTLDREKGAMVVYTRGFNPPFFGLSISGNNAIVPQTKLAPSKRLQTNPRAAIDPPPSESFQVDGVEQPQDCPKQSPMQEMESLDTSSKKVNTFAASISGQKLPPNTPKRAFVKHPGPSEAKPNHSLLSPTALVRDKNEAAASNVPRGESTGFTQKLDESIAISLSTGYFMSTTTEGEREVAVQTSSQSRSTAHQPEGSRQDQASRQASPMTSKPISVGRSGPSSDTTERQRPSSPLSFHSGGREEAKRPTTSFPGAQIQNRLYREGLSSPYLAKVCSPSNSMTQAKSNKSEKTLSIFDETEANPKQTSLIESNKKSQQPNESTPWLAAAEGSRNVIDAKIDKEIQNHIQLDPEAAYLVDAPEDCSPRSHHSSLSRRSEQQSACLATPLQESSPRCQLSSLIQQSDKQQNEGTFDDTKNGRSRQEQPARYPVTTIPEHKEPKSYAMTAVSEQRFAREQMTKEERKREKKRKRKERKEKKKLKKERKRERKRKKSSSGRAIPVEDGAASSGEEEVVLVGVRNSPANSAGHDGTGRPRSQAEAHSKASIAAVKFRSEQPIRQEKSPENGVSRATRTDNRCDGSNISVNCAPPAASDGPDGLLGAFRRQQVNTQLPQTKKIETEKQFGANLKERKTPDALATMISTQQNAPQSPNVYRTQLGTGLNAADTTYRGYNELNNGPYEESNVPRSNATDYSIRHHSPASGNKFSRLPPIELLCSETFIEKWSEPIAELATGRWPSTFICGANKKLTEPKPDSEFYGRKIRFSDTPILDQSGVDIELPGRCAVIVSSVTSWAADADLFVKNIFEKASMERYDELVLILCLDTDMSKELCSKMLRLNKVTHSTIPIHIQTSSWVSLSATLASCVLKKCNSVDIKLYSEIVKQMSNEKMSERAGFLVSLVPTMSTMAAIQCLSLIAPAEGPVDQFQVLLASEVARKKLCSDLSKSPNIRELSNKSVLQLSCVLNEDLNEKMGL